ncbi:MAG: hypothetical protein ACP5FH_10710 [Terracidiphilus sp.]
MSESEPYDDASLKTQSTVKTGGVPYLQDQPERDLFTDSAAVGVKAASAQYRLWYLNYAHGHLATPENSVLQQ